MLQALRQRMKKWSTSVDTRPGKVDTSDRSERNKSIDCYSRSTLDGIRASQKSCWQLEEFSSLLLPSWCFSKPNSNMSKLEKWELIVEVAIGSPQGSRSSRSRLL
ncbi:hypothetical protein Taro_025423 [Colocasia esculenta]|uniref:Uncharacterized protein n=1 Tax=Colocasia esculenta TaxID=4460 RepID=A0A843VNA0_COLES|nr:hypothetical protein [Colocasia esculenta]